ncbi:unnamed protein product [Malus baccata var. baccata]
MGLGPHLELKTLFLVEYFNGKKVVSQLEKDVTLHSPTSDFSTSGEVHVIMGPMFAGKTTALLRRIKLEGNSGRNVAMIKSSKDTRYAIDSVVTQDGVKFPCGALSDLSWFRQNFGGDAYDEVILELGKYYELGPDNPPYAAKFYNFCGAEDPEASSCTTSFHVSYNDD